VRLYSLIWLGSGVLAAAALARPADGTKDREFVVHTADGVDSRAILRELGPDWSLRCGDGPGKKIAATDAVSIRRPGAALPPMPADEHIVLANGDRLPISKVRLDGEKLLGRCEDFEDVEVQLPLSNVAVWWRRAPENAAAQDQFLRRLLAKERKNDVVYMLNGDVLEGALEAIDDKRVSIEVEKKSIATELSRVAAVAISSEPARGLLPKGLHARLTLDSGARLTLLSAEYRDGKALKVRTSFGANVQVPLGQVIALDWLGGRAVYLSDLKPAGFDEPLPYPGVDGIRWPPVIDGSVDDGNLRLGGSTYAKGIGMHSSGRLRYSLGKAYRRFEASVGLDDKTGRRGSVRVRVLGDGRPLDIGFNDELTAKNGPVKVQADVTGVKELTLEVDVGRSGNVQGHVDWGDARVIK